MPWWWISTCQRKRCRVKPHPTLWLKTCLRSPCRSKCYTQFYGTRHARSHSLLCHAYVQRMCQAHSPGLNQTCRIFVESELWITWWIPSSQTYVCFSRCTLRALYWTDWYSYAHFWRCTWKECSMILEKILFEKREKWKFVISLHSLFILYNPCTFV